MRDVLRMVLVLGATCMLAAFGLAKVYDLTAEPIREAKRQEMLRAMRAVLPTFDNAPDQDTVVAGGRSYFRGREGSRLTGVAFPVTSTEGYAGPIEALVGVTPGGEVAGVIILAHTETPGLGAKFTASGFLDQFRNKTLDGARWEVRKDGGDFDQITGATITPRALVRAVRAGLAAYAERREEITGAGTLSPRAGEGT